MLVLSKRNCNPLIGLQKVIDYVNTHFLSKPYHPYFVSIYPKASELVKRKQIIYRPNHGLAHTLRGAYLVNKVADLYSNHTMSIVEKQKIQAAMLFFVVGRQNEMSFFDNPEIYQLFRQASADAFRQYARKNLMYLYKNDKEINKYYQALLNYHDPKNQELVVDIIRTCHCLDLIRCLPGTDLNDKLKYNIVNDIMIKQGVSYSIAQKKAQALMDYAANLIKATGNRIPYGPYQYSCHFKVFEKASKNPIYCLEKLKKYG